MAPGGSQLLTELGFLGRNVTTTFFLFQCLWLKSLPKVDSATKMS